MTPPLSHPHRVPDVPKASVREASPGQPPTPRRGHPIRTARPSRRPTWRAHLAGGGVLASSASARLPSRREGRSADLARAPRNLAGEGCNPRRVVSRRDQQSARGFGLSASQDPAGPSRGRMGDQSQHKFVVASVLHAAAPVTAIRQVQT